MGKNSKIEWCDHTWNPWYGCHKVSAGCKNCYMFREQKRWGREPNVVQRASKTTFNAPLRWANAGATGRIFTCSWSDFFIQEADKWRSDAWDIIRITPHLTYLILTKRPERIDECLPNDWGEGYPNVWLGVSVESQLNAKIRIPYLLDINASKRFLSCEPLLGELDLFEWIGPYHCMNCGYKGANSGPQSINGILTERDICPDCGDSDAFGFLNDDPYANRVDWIITGGESGTKKGCRFTNLEWFRSIRRQCQTAGVAYFHKQNGGIHKIDGAWGGRELDGKVYNEFPIM